MNILDKIQAVFSTLRAKMAICFMMVTISLIIIGCIFYNNAHKIITSNIIKSNENVISQISINFDLLMNEMLQLAEIGDEVTSHNFLSTEAINFQVNKDLLSIFKLYKNNYKFSENVQLVFVIV